MNKRTANCQRMGLIFRGFVVGMELFLSLLCHAETSATNSTVPPSNAAVTAAPTQYGECLQLLRGTDHVSSGLVEMVASLLNHPSDASPIVPQTPPSLMIVSYHDQAGEERDVVAQVFFDPIAGGQSVLNDDGYAHAHLGDELSGIANQLLGFIFRQVVYFGQKDEVECQRRAFQAMLNGDVSLLREQTVDPLHMLVVMPRAGTFLPSSLRSRVHGIVMDVEMAFGAWSGRVAMVTDDSDAAEQVGNIVAAWREMALSFADTFAGQISIKQVRESLKASTVQVVSNRVLTSASIDSRTIVLMSKEAAGRVDNCPPGGVCSKDKVAICHKVDSRHEQTMCVAPAEVAALLAQGDHCGPCARVDVQK
jgi:hypothetical protein